MPNLPKRLPYEILIAACLMMGSCNSNGNHFSDAERDEISDIASDDAVDPDKFANLRSRVDEIESRLNM